LDSRNIREMREAGGVSQHEMSEDLGISQVQLSNIERSGNVPEKHKEKLNRCDMSE
jgi:transcriptional regulator with XRE-family HTH domain